MDLHTLQEIYTSVETWHRKRLIAKVISDPSGDVCSLGTHPLYNRDVVKSCSTAQQVRDLEKRYKLDNDTLGKIYRKNDDFEGTPEERWEHMTKWLLDAIIAQKAMTSEVTEVLELVC